MADNSESVKSPSSSIEGVASNAGGMPPTWDTGRIFTENTPPNTPAKNSTDGLSTTTGGDK